MITDKLRSYGAAKREVMSGVEHRSNKGPNNRAEDSHQPTQQRERGMKRRKSPAHLQRFLSTHDPITNLFLLPRHEMRSLATQTWCEIAQGVAA
jgi:putative transposase